MDILIRVAPLEDAIQVAGIAFPNEASVILHKRLGYRKVAHFEQVGCKFKKWIDLSYWQLFL
ncbi:GNAT family N-acetyltransferase [bacterium]|nr:GNAT family N-acetyltransferase [bacterium]